MPGAKKNKCCPDTEKNGKSSKEKQCRTQCNDSEYSSLLGICQDRLNYQQTNLNAISTKILELEENADTRLTALENGTTVADLALVPTGTQGQVVTYNAFGTPVAASISTDNTILSNPPPTTFNILPIPTVTTQSDFNQYFYDEIDAAFQTVSTSISGLDTRVTALEAGGSGGSGGGGGSGGSGGNSVPAALDFAYDYDPSDADQSGQFNPNKSYQSSTTEITFNNLDSNSKPLSVNAGDTISFVSDDNEFNRYTVISIAELSGKLRISVNPEDTVYQAWSTLQNPQTVVVTPASSSSYNVNPTAKSITKYVTIAPKTVSNPRFGQGSANAFFVDGVEAPQLTFVEGNTYTFDLSDSSNTGIVLEFFTDETGTTSYSTNVVSTGTPGTTGATISVSIPSGFAGPIYYQRNVSSEFMGSILNISTRFASLAVSDCRQLIDSLTPRVFNRANQDLTGTNISIPRLDVSEVYASDTSRLVSNTTVDGEQFIDRDSLIIVLLGAVKELSAQINDLVEV